MSKSQEKALKESLAGLEEKMMSVKVEIHRLVTIRVKRTIIQCSICRKRIRLGRFSFLQNWWYTSPRGCNEGDYWNKSKADVCHIFCPECGEWNYIYRHPQKEQILDLVENQGLEKNEIFTEVWEKHGNFDSKRVFPEQ